MRRAVGAIVAQEGSALAAHPRALSAAEATTRDLADAVHALCALHGTAPSVIEIAADSNGAAEHRAWLRDAAVAFDAERRALVALTAAVGPLPSTPGQAESSAAIEGQRHALAMLARSDRAGCALGAALAFMLEWHALRALLEAAAARAGLATELNHLPSPVEIEGIADRAAADPRVARALAFGADQLVAQHRGLWHLLDARASARRGS